MGDRGGRAGAFFLCSKGPLNTHVGPEEKQLTGVVEGWLATPSGPAVNPHYGVADDFEPCMFFECKAHNTGNSSMYIFNVYFKKTTKKKILTLVETSETMVMASSLHRCIDTVGPTACQLTTGQRVRETDRQTGRGRGREADRDKQAERQRQTDSLGAHNFTSPVA